MLIKFANKVVHETYTKGFPNLKDKLEDKVVKINQKATNQIKIGSTTMTKLHS